MNKAKFEALPSLLDAPNRGKASNNSAIKIPTEKMEKFVEALLSGLSKEEASRAAGAPEGSNQKLLRYADAMLEKPAVQELLKRAREAAMAKMTGRLGALTVEYVENEFLSVYEESRAASDRPNALRALENLGKYLGMFQDKKGGDTYNTLINVEASQVDADLERLARAAGVELKLIGSSSTIKEKDEQN